MVSSVWIKLAALPVLLALVTVGAFARTTLPGRGAGLSLGTPVAILAAVTWLCGAAVILVAILLAVLRRRRRRNPDDHPHVVQIPRAGWTRAVGLLLVAVAFAVPVAILMTTARHGGTGASPGAPIRTVPVSATPPASARPGSSGDHDVLVALGVGALIVVVGCAVAARRPRPPSDVPPQPDDAELTVDAAVRRGSAAFAGQADARAAIIACYAAMEDGLADSGMPRQSTQTPSELLRVAARTGLVPRAPATQLTRLFERARFGAEPLTEADRADAHASLAALRGHR
jgi:preprotein translocase subunit SecG